MEKTIEITHCITGNVLFSYTSENNTISKTLVEGVKNKANLRWANLQGADFRGVNLQEADLRLANLQGADFRGADLRGADLQGAYLREADLRLANLQGADFRGADLREAYLREANLQLADLQGADFRGVNLQEADLRGAELQGADFRGADLRGAYFRGYKIKKAIIITGLYKYLVIPFISVDNEERIILGCHNRSVKEWESDFWNNDKEFPNNGNEASELRLIAYNTAKEWLRIQIKINK